MRYRSRPVVIEAHQWFKNGDHPLDNCTEVKATDSGETYKSEGKLVRYYRHPAVPGHVTCRICETAMHYHGWIETLEGGQIVCPGDYIITGTRGEHYPCKPEIFNEKYEPLEGAS